MRDNRIRVKPGETLFLYNDGLFDIAFVTKAYETNKTYEELQTLWEELDKQIQILEPKVELAIKEFLASNPENENDEELFERVAFLQVDLEELKEKIYKVEREIEVKSK